MTTPALQTNEGDIEFRPRYAASPTKTPSKRGGRPGMSRLIDCKSTAREDAHYEQWNFAGLCDEHVKLEAESYGMTSL